MTTPVQLDYRPHDRGAAPNARLQTWAIALVILGDIGIVAAIVASVIGRIHGELLAHITFATSLAAAAAMAGVALTRPWRTAGLLAALACLGQAAALELYHDTVWLQWLSRWRDLITPRYAPFAAIIVVQAVFVVGYARRHWGRWWACVPRTSAGRGALTVLLLLGSSVCGVRYVASGGWSGFLTEMSLAVPLMAVAGLNLAVVAAELPESVLQRWRKRCTAAFVPTRAVATGMLGTRLHWLAAAWVLVVSSLLAVTTFERIPQLPDDVSMYWHAKYFAAGRLYLDPPPTTDSFWLYLLVNDGHKWYAHSTPGWPAILAVGFLIQAPWLVNPVLGALSVLLVHRLARRLYSWRTAQVSVLLLASSPWFLVLSATYMSHSCMLFWTLCALVAAEAATRCSSAVWAAAGGASLGAVFLTRPLEGIIAGSIVAGWVLWDALHRRRLGLCAALVTGVVGVGVWAFVYNHVLTGAWTEFPTTRAMVTEHDPRTFRMGFGPDIGTGWSYLDPLPGHGWRDVLINANHNLYWVSFETFGWQCGSLIILMAGVLWLRPAGADWLLLGLAAAVVGAYSLYYFSGGPDYGARYWYLCLPSIVVLSANWLLRLIEREGEPGGSGLRGARASVAMTAALAVALVTVVPWRAVNKYPHRRGMQTQLADLERRHDWNNALVFVRVTQPGDFGQAAYRSAFIRNSPSLGGPGPVYARDKGAEANGRLAARYPSRSVWTVEGPRTAGDGYRVISGRGSLR